MTFVVATAAKSGVMHAAIANGPGRLRLKADRPSVAKARCFLSTQEDRAIPDAISRIATISFKTPWLMSSF
jgi:hypothetical protein